MCAQLRARKLDKVAALIPQLRPTVPLLLGKSKCCASFREHSNLDESPEDLEKSTEWIFCVWIFQGNLYYCSDFPRAKRKVIKQNEAETRAVVWVVEQQCLPKFPVSVQHMAIFFPLQIPKKIYDWNLDWYFTFQFLDRKFDFWEKEDSSTRVARKLAVG